MYSRYLATIPERHFPVGGVCIPVPRGAAVDVVALLDNAEIEVDARRIPGRLTIRLSTAPAA